MQIRQLGHGAVRDVVLCYHVGDTSRLARVLGTEPAIASQVAGDYEKVGGDGVEPWQDTVSRLQAGGGGFQVGRIWMCGWSAGCRGVRTQMREAGARPDVVLCADGIHVGTTPEDYQVAPWRKLRQEAMAGGPFFASSSSNIPTYGFQSTRAAAKAIWGLGPPGPGTPGDPYVERQGNFLWLSTDGTDAAEHVAHLEVVLPMMAEAALGARIGRRGVSGGWIAAAVAAVIGWFLVDELDLVAGPQRQGGKVELVV